MTTETTIRGLQKRDAEQLAKMLCNDDVLRRDLGLNIKDKPTAEKFLSKVLEWCRERRATTFAIVSGYITVGMISLSHLSEDGNTARIGFWVGTNHRRQEHCKRAFEAVLRQAASEGITSVSATVDANNEASLRIWEQQGATNMKVAPGRIRYELSITRQRLHAADSYSPRAADACR